MEAETVKTKAKPKREHVEHPAPEVMAREAAPDEIPKTVATMAKLAQEAGWEVSVTYARGTTYSTQPKLVHSVAVRMFRNGQRAVAAWVCPVESDRPAWKFDLGARLGRWTCQKTGMSGTFPIKLGSSELKVYLRTPLSTPTPELPVDVWLPSQEAADTQELFAQLARMFAGDDMEDVT